MHLLFIQIGIMHNNLYKVCDIESKINYSGSLRVKKPHWIIQKYNNSFARFKSVENIIYIFSSFSSLPVFSVGMT